MSDQFNRLSKVLARSFSLDDKSFQACFRVATVDEIPRISALRREVFTSEIDDNDEIYLRWRYFDSLSNGSNLWVFEYDDKLIAALGTEPVELWHDGESFNALRNMDAIVDPQYNSRGLGAWMTLAMQQSNDCVLVTGGNENSSSMLTKLFTALNVRKNYKIILHSQYFLRNKIASPIGVKIIAPFVDLFLTLMLKIRLLSIKQNRGWRLIQFDNVRDLLPLIRGRVGVLGDVRVLRTANHLKWRYAMNPGTRFSVLALMEAETCLGYIIYTCSGSSDSENGREAFIMDWDVFDQASKSLILSSLFKSAVEEMKINKIDEINIELNDKDSVASATKSGFIYRYDNPNFYVYHKYLSADDKFYSADAWYHSLGDSDNL